MLPATVIFEARRHGGSVVLPPPRRNAGRQRRGHLGIGCCSCNAGFSTATAVAVGGASTVAAAALRGVRRFKVATAQPLQCRAESDGSDDGWISREEFIAGAEYAIERIRSPLLREVLSLSFGMDNGWQRRTPLEVGHALGGRYAGNETLVVRTIQQALKTIPLVASDASQLEVLYEDEDLLAVMKPAFLRTTPLHRFVGKSLVNQLVGYLRPENGSTPPFILHRLDQGTSGIVLCAKRREALDYVAAAWDGPDCQKEYLAVARQRELQMPPAKISSHGAREVGTLENVGSVVLVRAPIGKDPEAAKQGLIRQCVDWRRGRPAATRLEVLGQSRGREDGGISAMLLRCVLEDFGRTHQIRVHAAHIGAPLLGDDLYGALHEVQGPPLIARTALHAWRLQVPHPRTGNPLRLEAAPPEDFCRCAAALQLNLPTST